MKNLIFKQVRQYQLKQIIGQGSYATVYLGFNQNNQCYAIKEIKLDFQDGSEESQKLLQYFDQEIEIYKNTKHNNLVSLIEEFYELDCRYCVFEYCSNGDLNNFTKRNILNEEEVKMIFTQILAGMQYLYEKGIVHRDLKLDNILIDSENTIKIADFGFAKFYQQDDLFVSYCGTPATMAPEVLNQQKYDFACDIWSLGVILYYMIFKKYHWRGNIKSLIELKKQLESFQVQFDSSVQLSDQGKNIISRMLTSNRKNRINYEELFSHPWLEGKLDQNKNLLESQCIIQKKLTTIQPGQVIGHVIKQQRKLRTEFCSIIDQIIRESKKEEVKAKYQKFKKSIIQQKFHITINTNDLSDKPHFELFDYKFELYELLYELYVEYELDNRETAQREFELIKFIEGNHLSNSIIFRLEELNTQAEIESVRRTIIEEELQEYEDKENWELETKETSETKIDVVQYVCADRVSLSQKDNLYNLNYIKSINILNKN